MWMIEKEGVIPMIDSWDPTDGREKSDWRGGREILEVGCEFE